ncbi:MAG: peptidase MA family metallohydrolase [Ardenticatenaceae bacterium]|nr:peptidase MA family metallohydrolase [Ardenticatenaceae bacterium]
MTVGSVFGQREPLTILSNDALVNFPEHIDFEFSASLPDSEIISATLSYGVEKLACANIQRQVDVPIEAASLVELSWRWNILEDTLLPPGSIVWWEWKLTLADGTVETTPRSQLRYIDSWYVWQSVERDGIQVNWFRGERAFAERMLAAAVDARDQLGEETGLQITEPIELFLYEETFDLSRSLPGIPAWAGGVAFPEQNLVMVATNSRSPEAIEYGERTIKHEIGHLVIGRLTFNCQTNLPTWLNEGLAQVAEGPPDPYYETLFAEAITNERILSLAQLEGSFSVHRSRASLSYAQSDYFTRYLLDQYGPEQMANLLTAFKQGVGNQEAFQIAYEEDLLTLENGWRTSLGLSPLTAAEQTAPTTVPTAALLVAPTIEPTDLPVTATPAPTAKTATPAAVAEKPVEISADQPLSETELPSTEINQPAPSLLVGAGILIVLLVVISLIYTAKRKEPDQ